MTTVVKSSTCNDCEYIVTLENGEVKDVKLIESSNDGFFVGIFFCMILILVLLAGYFIGKENGSRVVHS